MSATLHLITAPVGRPVSLVEVKDYCRITDNTVDAKLDAFIEEAVAYLDGRDGILGRALIEQTWELRLREFPAEICVPLPPFRSLTSIKYLDYNGNTQTLGATDYRLMNSDLTDFGFGPAKILPPYMSWWAGASTLRWQDDAVRVRFIAGYATFANGGLTGTIPRPIINWICAYVLKRLDNPQDQSAPDISPLAPFITSWV